MKSIRHGREAGPVVETRPALFTDGRVEMAFAELAKREGFRDEAARLKLRAQLAEIGVEVDASGIGGWPSARLEVLVDDAVRREFFSIWEVAADRTRTAASMR